MCNECTKRTCNCAHVERAELERPNRNFFKLNFSSSISHTSPSPTISPPPLSLPPSSPWLPTLTPEAVLSTFLVVAGAKTLSMPPLPPPPPPPLAPPYPPLHPSPHPPLLSSLPPSPLQPPRLLA
ncbi:unnamed protein product [Closterium sp. NIES-54]